MGCRKIRNKRGQTVVEFALSLLVIVGLGMMYMQVALMAAYGSFAQYATFMAARAYLSAGGNAEDQEKRAIETIQAFLKQSGSSLDRYASVAVGVGENAQARGITILRGDPELDSATDWRVGVRYKFRSPLFLTPLGGDSSTSRLTLETGWYLGREPSEGNCREDLLSRTERVVVDNGC